ncbi:uncharacterized protein N7469_002309 [Penicillium citrinum]|uniref:Uncharacterized protein n=1 Tax=Penicillium citrinum TaxID=5077 RepID=A0A9W9PCF4_PENCI|nr:uncharacterized protein N7469_002309 [Penicillium citrinum]KAJ5240718.1 hypothetical protein N7469_002309 [Penicillium citrinum]
MGAIQKPPHPRKMPDFRRRLQRALSLSSSESEYSQSPTASLSGDTTEEESTHSSGNHQAASQQSDPPNDVQDGGVPIPQLGGYGVQSLRDSNLLALQCVAEILERSMADQRKCIEDVRRHLEGLSHRWKAIETGVDEGLECDPTHKPDEPGQKTLRARRLQR